MRKHFVGLVFISLALLTFISEASELPEISIAKGGDESHKEAVRALRKAATPRRRGAIKGVATTDAHTSFTHYHSTVCTAQEWSDEECRHQFIILKLGFLFREGAGGSLNTWLHLNDDSVYKLSHKNVILQSGTAVWMYGCRPHQMTNDVDAWLAPGSPAAISFNNDNKERPFNWQVISDDGEVITTWLHPFQITFVGHEDRASIFDIRTVDKDGNAQWVPLEGTVDGHLARIEYLRDGEVLFYLLEYDKAGKAGGTKDPKVRMRPGNVDYSPWVLYGALGVKQSSQETFELDLYTPFGALDGDYQWPWVETGKYLLDNPPGETRVPVIPRHVAIVQKLKLYFDCFIVNDGHYHNEPHRVKHDPASPGPSTAFFKKNYDKMSQDIDDLACLCAQCQAQGDEVCMSLCSVVQVIESGVAPGILPDKQQLYDDYQRALDEHHHLAAMDIARPGRHELSEEITSTMVERLTHLRDVLLDDWKEKTLVQRLKTSSKINELIALFTPRVAPQEVVPQSLAQEADQLEADISGLMDELADGFTEKSKAKEDEDDK